MTIEQCCETLFKSMQNLTIGLSVLIGVEAILIIGKLNEIEHQLKRLVEDKENDTGL